MDAIITGEQTASDRNVVGYLRNRTIATYWRLHLLVYEGGQAEEGDPTGPGPPVDPNLPNQFAAARDPRMADVELHDLFDNWYPSGGEPYMHFSHVGRYHVYGMWGLSDDLNNQSSGKWNGIVQAIGTAAPSITAGTTLRGVVSANVRFWRAPSARFEQWLVRSETGGAYQLVINLDTRFADTQQTLSPSRCWASSYSVMGQSAVTERCMGFEDRRSPLSVLASARKRGSSASRG